MHNQDRDMQLWKQSIQAGNTCFDSQQNTLALRHYQQAIRLANSFFDYHQDPRAAVASVLVSYHNLADLYMRMEQANLAEQALLKGYSVICDALNQTTEDGARLDALLWGGGSRLLGAHDAQEKHNEQAATAAYPSLPIANYM